MSLTQKNKFIFNFSGFFLCSIKIPPAKLLSIYRSTINSVSSLNLLTDVELFWN